jgi:hypothetical protein
MRRPLGGWFAALSCLLACGTAPLPRVDPGSPPPPPTVDLTVPPAPPPLPCAGIETGPTVFMDVPLPSKATAVLKFDGTGFIKLN